MTILLFRRQFKQACDSNRVSDTVAMWFLSFHMAKSPATSLTTFLSPFNNDNAPLLLCRRIQNQKRIFTYIEDANYLTNSYATDDVIAKATLKISPFKKFKNKMAVQFPKRG